MRAPASLRALLLCNFVWLASSQTVDAVPSENMWYQFISLICFFYFSLYLSIYIAKALKFYLWRVRLWVLYRFRMKDRSSLITDNLASIVIAGMSLLIAFPWLMLAGISIAFFLIGLYSAGIAILVVHLSAFCFYFGLQSWSSSGWHFNSIFTSIPLVLSVLLYFFMMITLSRLEEGSFFALSMHFVVANSICQIELIFSAEQRKLLVPEMYTSKISLSQENTKSSEFAVQVKAAIHEYQMNGRMSHIHRSFFLLVTSLLTLGVYSAFTYYIDGETTGLIISAFILVLDMLLFMYASSGGLSRASTKIAVVLGVRAASVSFGHDSWFSGTCLVYVFLGCFLAYNVSIERIPLSRSKVRLAAQHARASHMRLSEFLPGTDYVDPDEKWRPEGVVATSVVGSVVSTVERSCLRLSEFVLIVLTMMFFMFAAFASRQGTHPGYQIFGGVIQCPEMTLLCLGIVICFFFTALTLRFYKANGMEVSCRFVVTAIVNQLVYHAYGLLLYLQFEARIVGLFTMTIPILIITSTCTYWHFLLTDWRLLQDKRRRNPPNRGCCSAFCSMNLPWLDYKGLLLIILSTVCGGGTFLALVMFVQPFSMGISIALIVCIVIFISIPLFKYITTLDFHTADKIFVALAGLSTIGLIGVLAMYNDNWMTSSPDDSWDKASTLWIAIVMTSSFAALALAVGIFALVEEGGSIPVILKAGVLLSVADVTLFVIYIFSHVSTEYGIFATGLVLSILTELLLFIKWLSNNCYLTAGLRYLSVATVAVIMAGSIWMATVEDIMWINLCAASVGVYSAAVIYGDIRSKGNLIFFSPQFFPIFFFDNRRDDVFDMSRSFVYATVVFGLSLIWCVVSIVVWKLEADTFLALSAFIVLCIYTAARGTSLVAAKKFTEYASFLDKGIVFTALKRAVDAQISNACDALSEEVARANQQPEDIERIWGAAYERLQRLLYSRSDAGTDEDLDGDDDIAEANFTDEELEVRARWRHNKWLELADLEDKLVLLRSMRRRQEAHFFFVSTSLAQSKIKSEETLFKEFVKWLNVNKDPGEYLPPITTTISNSDIFKGADRWEPKFIDGYRKYKEMFISQRQKETEDNNRRRAAEDEARRLRDILAQKRAQQLAKKQKQEQKRKKPALDSDESSELSAGGDGEQEMQRAAWQGDSPEMFKEILRTHTAGKKFVDPAFPATNFSVYYEGRRNPIANPNSALNKVRLQEDWKRPSELEQVVKGGKQPVLKEGGWDLEDVMQGKIGDCYFISALGAMALYEKRHPDKPVLTALAKDMMGDVDLESSSACGAYMFKFYRAGRPIHVIVDDLLPVGTDGELAFSHCVSPTEMWVALIEKAYAKMNSCYEAIESGKVHLALVDCTNGASEEVRLDQSESGEAVDANAIWSRMMDDYKSGYLLAVGSNSGVDTNITDGIAMGHAYGLVQLYEGFGERLIELQNPWGKNSVEWTGDWSDDSEKWTRKWENRLKVTRGTVSDGKFWMAFEDFLAYFRNLYVCRLLQERLVQRSEWKGVTACGAANPKDNPHFLLTAGKPTKVFIEITQDAPMDRKSKERAYMAFYVFDNGGKRVNKIKRGSDLLAFVKPKNDRSLSKELWIATPKKPLTILCTTSKPYETTFSITVFLESEANVKLEPFKDNQPLSSPDS